VDVVIDQDPFREWEVVAQRTDQQLTVSHNSPPERQQKKYIIIFCFHAHPLFTRTLPFLSPTRASRPLNARWLTRIMENTRVFVSGLPPTLTNDQLLKHFSSGFDVTDAHVLPNRRIGFVGFRSNAAAQEAVRHFNKTFIRMSKIAVELARPVSGILCILSFFS
jgi:hypothetical protein